MQMISAGRANVVPPILTAACLVLIFARFCLIAYDAFVTPPPVNLVNWQTPIAINPDYANVSERPTLYYFVDTKNTLDALKCQLFESTVMKNREVAQAMRELFRCVKVDRATKEDKVAQGIFKHFEVEETPQLIVALSNGKVVSSSIVQLSDRLFVSSLKDAADRSVKIAADVSMARADFVNALPSYKKYLTFPGNSDEARLHTLIRYYIALRSLGMTNEAKDALAKYTKKNDYSPIQCIKYLKGEMTEAELFKQYGKFNATTCKYVIGMKHLFDGDRAGAIPALRWAAERGSKYNPDSDNATGQLKKMGETVPPRPSGDDDLSDESTYSGNFE